MRIFLLWFLAFAVVRVQAAEPIKTAPEIEQATVYLKGAVLRNKATANLPAGRSTVLLTGLSYNVLRESIRLKPEGCRILSVSLSKNFMDLVTLSDKIAKMREEQLRLQAKNADYGDELSIYESEKQLILANQAIGGQQNGVDPEKLRITADFFRQRLSDILNKERVLKTEMAKNDKRVLELGLQINESGAKNIYPTSEIELEVEAEKAGQAKFVLEYFISEAGWFPTYDFRVNNLTEPMEMDYVAHIYQNSGLDWKNVEISVSSMDPGNNSGIPILKPWNISQFNHRLEYDINRPMGELNRVTGRVQDPSGRPIPFANVMLENSSVGTNTDFDGRFDLMLPSGAGTLTVSAAGFNKLSLAAQANFMTFVLYAQPNRLQEIAEQKVAADRAGEAFSEMSAVSVETVSDSDHARAGYYKKEVSRITASNVTTNTLAVSFEYTLKEKINVPSDGRTHTSLMLKREVPVQYMHQATPKLSTNAYLSLAIPEWEKLNLLEGEVNLYFGNSYTGKSVLSLKNLSDSLVFSMGKNPNVMIQRSLLSQKTTGGGILSNKESAYRWNTELRNTSTMPVKLTVTEPFPVSTEKEIKVELNKELSGAVIDREKGLLTWQITLQPGEQRKLEFGFSVIYPKNLNMRF